MKRTILVTGSTDGIGLQTAKDLLAAGHRVVVHGRSLAKAKAASDHLGAHGAIAFDLGKPAEIRTAAEQLSGLDLGPAAPDGGLVDSVVHNAGVFFTDWERAADGVEATLSINHLGPVLLTHTLMPVFRRPDARLVFVASVAHTRAQMHWDNLDLQTGYAQGYPAYGRSKLANVLFATALARRFDPAQVTSNSLHPGVVSTKLLRTGFGMEGPDSLQAGAATSVHLAASADVAGKTGLYWARSQVTGASPLARDEAEQERLWQWTHEVLGLDPASWQSYT
jgi:NAD(P)-dependent dehydrogenase (short-subunit alcohol dehydrogenase family)